MGMIAVFGIFVLVAFLVTVIIRRAYWTTGLIVGSVPAALVAVESPAAMINPLSWPVMLSLWGFCCAGGLTGAWLAKLVHAHWRRA